MLFGLFSKKNTHSVEWYDFDKMIEGKHYVVHVDEAHYSPLDKIEYKNLLVVEYTILRPDQKGFPSTEEKEHIEHTTEAIAAKLNTLTSAWYVGSMYGAGQAVAYITSVDVVDELIVREILTKAQLPHVVTWSVDEGWNFITAMLHPTEKERQQSMNATMLGLIASEQNDTEMVLPRGIAHVILCKTSESASLCVELLQQQGYALVGSIQATKDKEFPFFIEMAKDCVLDSATITAQTDYIIDLVGKNNSKYDGWQPLRNIATNA